MSEQFAGNRFLAHTGARFPIIQAPMTWIARAQLASAVSAAGALGMMETSSVDVEVTRREYTAISVWSQRGKRLFTMVYAMSPLGKACGKRWLTTPRSWFTVVSVRGVHGALIGAHRREHERPAVG